MKIRQLGLVALLGAAALDIIGFVVVFLLHYSHGILFVDAGLVTWAIGFVLLWYDVRSGEE